MFVFHRFQYSMSREETWEHDGIYTLESWMSATNAMEIKVIDFHFITHSYDYIE